MLPATVTGWRDRGRGLPVELPGVGHYLQIETPEVFTRSALSLLSVAH